MAYGNIYNETWWGDGIYNTIGWGGIYKSIALQGLLDRYSENALFGYSLRKVKSDAEFCVRVRRASDNAEENIGFNSDNIIDTDALESFAGGGVSYVVIWYNQLGGTIHLTQSVEASQPYITGDDGLVFRDTTENLPYVWFGADRSLEYTQTGGVYDDKAGWAVEAQLLSGEYSLFFTGQSHRFGGDANIVDGGTDSVILSDDALRYNVNGVTASAVLADDGFNDLYLWEISRNSSNGLIVYRDGTEVISGTSSAGDFDLVNVGDSFEGDVFELIGYDGAAERGGVFNNIYAYYNIEGYVQAALAYVNAFVTRVEADGGSVESTDCLVKDLAPLVHPYEPQ